MTVEVDIERWNLARRALRKTGDQFTELSTRVAADRSATRDWSVAVTAAHVASVAGLAAAIAGGEPLPLPTQAARTAFATATVETVAGLNDVVLAEFSERDPKVLAEQIRAEVDAILKHCEHRDPAEGLPWLGSSTVPLAGLVAHLVNEFQIHGHDVARGTGAAWHIEPAEAALFFELFIVGLLHLDYGTLLDTAEPLPRKRIAVEFTSKYTTPATLLLDDEVVSLAPHVPPDVRLRFDPVVLNLMQFGRMSRTRALITGGVRVGGPRPWLLPAFQRKLRMPS